MRRGGGFRRIGAVVAAALLVLTLAGPASAAPLITGFSPTHGPVGTSVVISGTGFTDANEVSFAGTAATAYAVDNDTQITATVPDGASSGVISVTTPDGTTTSLVPFTVDPPPPPPVIDSFAPDHGPEHASVVISGSGFTGATDVAFGGTSATYTVDDDTQITATVPVGAPNGPISVTTAVETATSADDFFVQPNIVMILTDDQRWDTLPAMPIVESQLVAKGITFSNGFVVNAVCCPSRVSFLTGEYSHTSGVYSNNPPLGGFSSFHGDASTIATWLQARDYRTALIGKYLNHYGETAPTYVPPGWDRWVAFGGKTGFFDYDLSIQGVVQHYDSAEADYSTDVLVGFADSFIRDASQQQPILLWYTPYAPHKPATPAPRDAGSFSGISPWRPPSFNEKDVTDKPAYLRSTPRLTTSEVAQNDALRQIQYESLQAVDDSVGTILQALADTQRLDNTIMLFASDNGYLWGEHRLTGKNVAYEESIRIPYVLRWDRLPNVPRTDTSLVTNIDVAPTFAQVAGTAAPGADGESLVPLLQQSSTTWRTQFLIEHFGDSSHTAPSFCAIRNQTQIFVHYATGEEEFYTLLSDPYELKNRIGNAKNQNAITRLRNKARTLCTPLPPGMPSF